MIYKYQKNDYYPVNNNGKIYGYIQYSDGSKVLNSTVLLWEGSPLGWNNLPDEITYTDSNGYYEFENLKYGRYHISPNTNGFHITDKNVLLTQENPEVIIDFIAVKGIDNMNAKFSNILLNTLQYYSVFS